MSDTVTVTLTLEEIEQLQQALVVDSMALKPDMSQSDYEARVSAYSRLSRAIGEKGDLTAEVAHLESRQPALRAEYMDHMLGTARDGTPDVGKIIPLPSARAR